MRVQATLRFKRWLDRLDDLAGRARILARVKRLGEGNPGRFRRLKHGVSEMKIDAGPGYRLYYVVRRKRLIILLCGGDKSSQPQDIELAYRLARGLEA